MMAGDWSATKQQVEANGDVLTVTMEELRNVHGAGKLGRNVCGEISKELVGMGIGHIPEPLPSNQTDLVRLYKRGTQAGGLIEAVLRPGAGNDNLVRTAARTGGTSSDTILAQIRDLVAE